jgi:hypothetical protein
MPFTLVQQSPVGIAGAGRTIDVTFSNNITKGSLVIGLCAISPVVGFSNAETMTVADNLSNSFSPTSLTMRDGSFFTGIFYNLSHPGTADELIFSITSGAFTTPSIAWAYEFSPSGPVLFDQDAGADSATSTDPIANINPAQLGELVVAIIMCSTGPGPYNGAQPPWTVGPTYGSFNAASEYCLSSPAQLNTSFTYNGQPNPKFGPGSVMMAAFADPQIYAWVGQAQGN